MNTQEIVDAIRKEHPDRVLWAEFDAIDPWIEVEPESLAEICRALKDDPQLSFDTLHCISAVDYCEPDEKKAAKVDWQPHIELLYHVSSIKHRHRIVVRVRLPRWKDGIEGRLPELPSVAGVWRSANWHEREVYDLSGVEFSGHPDLRRILCADDWLGHPLRKDYKQPNEYHGISTQ